MLKRRMTAFRLPLETIARIDVLAAELQRRSPGKVSQADAIAWAIDRAVADLFERVPEPTSPPEPAASPPVHAEYDIDRDRKSRAKTGPPTLQTKRRVAGIGGKLAQEADQAGREIDMMDESRAAAARREETDRLAREGALKNAGSARTGIRRQDGPF